MSDQERCASEKDGNRCVLVSGHGSAHFALPQIGEHVVFGGAAGGGKTQMLGDLHNAMTKAVTSALPTCAMCGESLGAQYATANPPDGRMFCSNGCLAMAAAARSMGEASRESQDKSAIAILEAHYPRREPVAPWARSGGGQNCTTGFNWTTRQWDDESHYKGSVALYSRPAPHGGGGNQAVCEACAERAGVFGTVDAAVPNPPGPLYPTPKPSWTDRPTCAGSLATHGTPVLRVTYWLGTPRAKVMLCDACYLDSEALTFRCEEGHRQSREWNAMNNANHEPTGRVGTVPQSLGPGAGIGIWASRGMR